MSQAQDYRDLAPPAIEVLWREIAARYGQAAHDELKSVYDAAHRRYGRAQTLIRYQQDVQKMPLRKQRGWNAEKIDIQVSYRQNALDNPAAFIAGELDDPPVGGKFKRGSSQ